MIIRVTTHWVPSVVSGILRKFSSVNLGIPKDVEQCDENAPSHRVINTWLSL